MVKTEMRPVDVFDRSLLKKGAQIKYTLRYPDGVVYDYGDSYTCVRNTMRGCIVAQMTLVTIRRSDHVKSVMKHAFDQR